MHTLLFLCTGNYYRSRFAEILFNSLASQSRLNWIATSRGIAVEFGIGNVGPISVDTLEALKARGISCDRNMRFPLRLQEQDLRQADRIIALDETEHRPMLEARFPAWAQRVEYWHIADLHMTSARDALPAIEREVHALIQELAAQPVEI